MRIQLNRQYLHFQPGAIVDTLPPGVCDELIASGRAKAFTPAVSPPATVDPVDETESDDESDADEGDAPEAKELDPSAVSNKMIQSPADPKASSVGAGMGVKNKSKRGKHR